MYPPEVRRGTVSSAEKHMFGRLHQGLPDADWLVLHSLGLAGHDRKPWAEIDFVLVGPPGVLCLEVKGGRVARREGKWIFTDRNDRTSEKTEGPFQQVGSASAALRRHLLQKAGWMHQCLVGYGVVVPDIRFEVEGPDIELGVVYDSGDEAKGVLDYVVRLSTYWRARLPSATRILSETDRAMLLEVMRGDFDLRPSLRTRVGLVNEELVRLTREQYRVLDGLADNQRVLIRGGAGTGKTLLAVEEALCAAADGMRVLLCCFNRNLAQFLTKAVLDQPRISVAHLHGLMMAMVDEAQMRTRHPDADAEDIFSVFLPDLAAEALIGLGRAEFYDLLILDEAQDLLREKYLEFLSLLLKNGLENGRWRFFLDPRQNVFKAIHPKTMEWVLSLAPAQFRLQVNCRNTMPIAVATSLLSGVGSDETRVVEGPAVDQFWYSEPRQERRMISRHLNRILSEGIRSEDVTILSRRQLSHSCLRDGLDEGPYRLIELSGALLERGRNTIGFSTIAGYKGLESDVVLVIDVDDLEDEACLEALYVGASRARACLGVFLAERVRPMYEDHAREFGRRLGGEVVAGPG
jgi:hypothetical protein